MSNWENIQSNTNNAINNSFGYRCSLLRTGYFPLYIDAVYDATFDMIEYDNDVEIASTAPAISAKLSDIVASYGNSFMASDIRAIIVFNNDGTVKTGLKPREIHKDGQGGIDIICTEY